MMPGALATLLAPPPQEADAYSVELTAYVGHEDEVLRLRNANRNVMKTRDYLDWRYRALPGLPPPRIAWLRDARGQALGMAAAIYRTFWVDGAASAVAVIGDISLDARLRGQGLGQRLLAELSREIARAPGGGGGFVIPTEAARRSLEALGWHEGGELLSYVCVIDPTVRLARGLVSRRFAAVLASPVRAALTLAARMQRGRSCSIELADDFDEQFDALWSRLPKANLILGDRSRAILRWRYGTHPRRRFRALRFLRSGLLCGYLIFESSEDGSDLSVQDIAVADHDDLLRMLALFVSWCLAQREVATVRMTLSRKHPLAAQLWRLCFVSREVQGKFLVLDTPAPSVRFTGTWCLTSGDKDI